MIASLGVGALCGLLATVVAWWLIPASTYVEDALGLVLITFAVVFVISGFMHRRLRRMRA